MSFRIAMVLAVAALLTLLNVGALFIGGSAPSNAAVGGMGYADLVRDPDFARAVRSIAEKCTLNIDLGKLKC